MNFGQALELLKQGKRVARKGWNGKGMYIYMALNSIVEVPEDLGKTEVLPTLVMKTANNMLCIGWLASQTDIFAEDWVVVE